MMDEQVKKSRINGFSKLSKRKKIQWIAENFFRDPEKVFSELSNYWHKNEKEQALFDGFSENTISNFILPYGVAPNFLINGKMHCVPMVIEESSVVAAASSAAKFWSTRGGIKCTVLNTEKIGHVHFNYQGPQEKLFEGEAILKAKLIESVKPITASMEARGGGISDISIKKTEGLQEAYQLFVRFETCDSMGANFINSVLEEMSKALIDFFKQDSESVEIVMSILSNYNPSCLVKAEVSCSIDELGSFEGNMSAQTFAHRFYQAVNVALNDPYRAVTHNKGIFNGIDAVVLATANDFRAIEAGAHAFACRDGKYKSLSTCNINDGQFQFELTVPLALGTVGGLTKLHPMAKKSLELLDNPSAKELMEITAATGLAQNFAAIRSLVTSGIQKGHMKMHLQNIIQQLEIPENHTKAVEAYFSDKVVSVSAVRAFYNELRV